ncbi:hypothetical protein PPROV_000329300 [Pycnococcus provasolii]|uniref:Dirigent protein n=1 Tax=Pycnococcus provasolii TaxID=41880 RepID=A0A6U0FBT9_9CHLO|nr:hypothetical protein PPROV_000329300 [Pycnococcus provasolii]|mmetsp:Transcript_3840/g.8630  ORF Transcript_3840/g.8630 Transcript_3840/m.8630 type:complete len:154 (+) Transcript_3840:145-606(+)|eukprot:CAMPEP_0206127138 /NCGR_PEP_ID=MMETSP1472-20131121/25510_1 /ASSEMBLY_ACC=CAM_ASM_001108 /TAXON_ID=41880 /ORGANISM="Pycnococcus provasolii, Strain RCC251" /LENGTH=153 /DNA_ID=CAMNT_0053518213 /DNA_START=141 /DNA_END=602 /DNA_ORIENTATION=-
MASKRWILLLLLLFCFRHCSGYDYDDDDDDDNGANQRAIRAYELNDDDGGEGRRGFVDPNGTAKLVSIVVVDTTSTTTTTTTAANRSELVEGLLVNTLTKVRVIMVEALANKSTPTSLSEDASLPVMLPADARNGTLNGSSFAIGIPRITNGG